MSHNSKLVRCNLCIKLKLLAKNTAYKFRIFKTKRKFSFSARLRLFSPLLKPSRAHARTQLTVSLFFFSFALAAEASGSL